MSRKIQITLKDPDGVYESLKDFAMDEDDETIRGRLQDRVSELEDEVRRWVEYGEYVRIEIDLDEGTARVVEN